MSAWSSFVDLLQTRALTSEDRLAFRFLEDGVDSREITYGELDLAARRIAARLQVYACRGERAVLLYPPGLEYVAAFFGCLYAEAIAVPAYPPMNPRQMARLGTLLGDADPKFILSTGAIAEVGRQLAGSVGTLGSAARARWITTDTSAAPPALSWVPPQVTADTIAFLQYTSGTTGRPKGVEVTHGNLLNNSEFIRQRFEHDGDSSGVVWLPPYHDMGLVGGILQPVYVGFPVSLMSPLRFLRDPLAWLRAVSRFRATSSGGPNFAFDLCVRKSAPEDRASLDLSAWKVAFIGADTVSEGTIDRFAAAFKPAGFRPEAFYPCYGLAEATLMVTGGFPSRPVVVGGFVDEDLGRGIARPSTDAGARRLVGCGIPAQDHELEIVDPVKGLPRGEAEVGEIWVRGPSVTRGYWRTPGWPEEVVGRLGEADGGLTYLRTGDLGFRRDGELFITGRMKDVIVIRGRNYWPQDIELTVGECDPRLRPGAGVAFAVDGPEGSSLFIAHEVMEPRRLQQPEADRLVQLIRASVAEVYGLAAHIVALLDKGTLPRTTSGKLQRSSCRRDLLEGRIHPLWIDTLPGTPREKVQDGARTIRELAARVLGVPLEALQLDQPLTVVGLDSVKAAELYGRLQDEARLSIRLERLLSNMSSAELAAEAVALPSDPESAGAAVTAESEDDDALTENERAIWFLQRLAPESRAYHLCIAVDVAGPLSAVDLARAVDLVTARHAALRTRFEMRGGEPRRVIGAISAQIESVDASNWSEAAIDADLATFAGSGLDLVRGPLWKIRHLRITPDHHVLALATHHIVADLWSLTVLVRDLLAHLSDGPTSPSPTAMSMREAARLERAYLDSEQARRDGATWSSLLAEAPPATDLPTDHPRPAVQSYRGAGHQFAFSASTSVALQELAGAQGVTPYAVLLASLALLLQRYTGSPDVVVGAPAPGRTERLTHDVVGMLVNVLPLRCHVGADQSFRQLLEQTASTLKQGLSGQRFPLARLVDLLRVPRDASRTPLFQIVMTLHHAPGHDGVAGFGLGVGEIAVGRLRLRGRRIAATSTPFDLTIDMVDYCGRVHGDLRYNADLFEPETIARLVEHWQNLLASACSNPDTAVANLSPLSQEERQQLVVEFNRRSEPPSRRLLHECVAKWSRLTPGATALTDGTVSLTYADLDQAATALAARLRQQSIGVESRIGILIGRSASFVVAALGVLSAGAAYVPLDAEHPAARLAAQVRDAGIRVILVEGEASMTAALRAALAQTGARLVPLAGDSAAWPRLERYPARLSAANAAYVMYTSGTTGVPKGVCVPHAAVPNLLDDLSSRVPLLPGDVCSWWTNGAFDVSVYEIFSALDAGCRLLVIPRNVRLDPQRLAEWLARNQVRSAYVPPFALEALADQVELARAQRDSIALRRLVVSVEPIPQETLRRIAAAVDGLHILNCYGPTETTIFSTCFEVDPGDARRGITPIGRGINNGPVYLLDGSGSLVPTGVPGEVYVGGVGVARGYLGRPGTTADRYLPDPWRPGGRVYRTGDYARYGRDGQLRFLGRRDSQVKLRGARIELGEVEAALRQDPRVCAAVAAVREVAGQRLLVGYVVADGDAPSAQELLARLRTTLPANMVPATVIRLQALPVTRNGKLDRAALPAPSLDPIGFEVPQGTVEAAVSAVWSGVLDGSPVGRHDDFFMRGGHSLIAERAALELGRHLGREVPVALLMANPTPATLAAALAGEAPVETPIVALPRAGRDDADLSERVRSLPDEVVARLLGEQPLEAN